MPKKFTGENSKAAVAKERKASAKADVDQKKKKQSEDDLWKDDDKNAMKKQNRKEDAERKKLEQKQRKQEQEALLKQEESIPVKGTTTKQPSAKVTRALVEAERKRMDENARKTKPGPPSKPVLEAPTPLQENINRELVEGEQASSVEEAISVLSVAGPDEVDRHPERRMKAAYKAFEEENLPLLKQQNPGMRLAQVKHLVSKEWSKSTRNPMNQQHKAYNAKS